MLIELGVNVNAVSKQGRTPFITAAAHRGAGETMRLLLEKRRRCEWQRYGRFNRPAGDCLCG